MRDVDFVITAHGATEAEGPNDPEQVDWIGTRYLIDAAGKIGVKHYVMISAASAGNPDSPLNARFGNVLIWKGRAEDYLRNSGPCLHDRARPPDSVTIPADKNPSFSNRADQAAACWNAKTWQPSRSLLWTTRPRSERPLSPEMPKAAQRSI